MPRPDGSPRIVSLLPSATEIVAALGFEDRLVGRSHACDYPLSVQRLPVCCQPRIDVTLESRAIHEQVGQAVVEALSIYRIAAEELERLKPTVIVTQTQCDVCAVSLRDVERSLSTMISPIPRIVAVQPMTLSDVQADILRIAEALDAPRSGMQLADQLRTALSKVAAMPIASTVRPTVVCIEWIEPLMVAGNWIPELVRIAGGEPLLSETGKHSPWITWDHLSAADPDVIVLMPCGFDMERTLEEMHLLREQSGWNDLRAVRTGMVFAVDGAQYFNRPGPRLVESAQTLADLLRIDLGSHLHSGRGWQRPSL